jgi:SAM-dependent methyltransferase
LGCGPGNLWLDNLERIPEGWAVTLSDLSPGMLAEARNNLGKAGRPFRFQVTDAQGIPFEAGSFDAIIANNMLYHVPDRPRALFEIHRVLRPGGRLYAATNGCDHLREIRALVSTLDPAADLSSAAAEFGLENGTEQLSLFFPHVCCHRYKDGLVVTEAEPLVAYILSARRSRMVEENPQALVQLIEGRMESEGAISITKDAGLFEAIKGD